MILVLDQKGLALPPTSSKQPTKNDSGRPVLSFVLSLQILRLTVRTLFHPVNQGQRKVCIGVTLSDSLTHSVLCSHNLLTSMDTMSLLVRRKEEHQSMKLSYQNSGINGLFFQDLLTHILAQILSDKKNPLKIALLKTNINVLLTLFLNPFKL